MANPSLSGLTDDEAKEFHGLFVSGFIAFTVIAVVAHFLVWQWRPWFPKVTGYASNLIDAAPSCVHQLISTLA